MNRDNFVSSVLVFTYGTLFFLISAHSGFSKASHAVVGSHTLVHGDLTKMTIKTRVLYNKVVIDSGEDGGGKMKTEWHASDMESDQMDMIDAYAS